MWQLGLETSARPARIALARDGGTCVERVLTADRAHASDLLPELSALLGEVRAGIEEVNAIFVGTGPGSFTGLRVGIATALGLARGLKARLYGIPSLELRAFASLAVGEAADLLFDARAGGLYFASYRRLEGELEVLCAPCLLEPHEARQRLDTRHRLLYDDGARRLSGLAARAFSAQDLDPPPSARALVELGRGRLERDGPMKVAELMPLYLRAFRARARKG